MPSLLLLHRQDDTLWIDKAAPVVLFGTDVLRDPGRHMSMWPGEDGVTIRAANGCVAYSLDPADKQGVRRGVLVYTDLS